MSNPYIKRVKVLEFSSGRPYLHQLYSAAWLAYGANVLVRCMVCVWWCYGCSRVACMAFVAVDPT